LLTQRVSREVFCRPEVTAAGIVDHDVEIARFAQRESKRLLNRRAIPRSSRTA
jgi:hypothetical protein